MQLNKLNNMIFLKNVESNIIDEAFIVLKDNVKIENKNNLSSLENKESKIEKINILKEAEELINKKINDSNLEYEKFKLKKLENKLKRLKLINILLVVGIISFIILFC